MTNTPLSPELTDIIEMIRRYNISNPEASFVFGFIGFFKDGEGQCEECEECGESHDVICPEKSAFGASGDLETLRIMLNDMRDIVEDNADDGLVNY